jgi:hypothetical protein
MTTGRVWESQVIDVRCESGVYKSRKWRVRGTLDRSFCYSVFSSSLIEARKEGRKIAGKTIQARLGIMAAPEYPKTPLNKLGRLPARGASSISSLYAFLESRFEADGKTL